MRKVLLLAVILSLFPVGFSACSSSGTDHLIQYACDTLFYQKEIIKQVDVAVGDTVTLVVCANNENGFKWTEKAEIYDKAVVQTSSKYTPPATADNKDTSGKETFVFKVVGGKTDSSLKLTFTRPSEGTSSFGTVTLIFIIKK